MNVSIIKKNWFLFCFFSIALHAQPFLVVQSQAMLNDFIVAQQQGCLNEYSAMVTIFSGRSKQSKKLLKILCTDINNCRRFIRKHAQHDPSFHKLLADLLALYNYVYTNQECCKAIQFHEVLHKKYQYAFHNSDIINSIQLNPHWYGLEKHRYKYRAYFKKIAADLKKIDTFEDTLHADYGLLKAHNYVYKIELIKIRNIIYHHVRYQFETRYF